MDNTDGAAAVTWPAQPLSCMPFCSHLPFSLLLFRPQHWNVAFRFQDYVATKNSLYKYDSENNKYNIFDGSLDYQMLKYSYGTEWKWQYFGLWNLPSNTGWNITTHDYAALDKLIGEQGAIDYKLMFTPLKDYYAQVCVASTFNIIRSILFFVFCFFMFPSFLVHCLFIIHELLCLFVYIFFVL